MILLLDDTARPTRPNILYDAHTGGNNSGNMRHDNPICRRTGAPAPLASTSGRMPRIVAQVVMGRKRSGQLRPQAGENGRCIR